MFRGGFPLLGLTPKGPGETGGPLALRSACGEVALGPEAWAPLVRHRVVKCFSALTPGRRAWV